MLDGCCISAQIQPWRQPLRGARYNWLAAVVCTFWWLVFPPLLIEVMTNAIPFPNIGEAFSMPFSPGMEGLQNIVEVATALTSHACKLQCLELCAAP